MKRRHVVAADDDPGYQKLLEEYLKADYDVVILQDGKEVLEYLKSHVPDMLVLDVGMPFVSGIEICDRVKLISRLKHVPVILITARGTETAIRMGCDVAPPEGILHKPFARSELLKTVARIFERQSTGT